jgi:hypothetical protein
MCSLLVNSIDNLDKDLCIGVVDWFLLLSIKLGRRRSCPFIASGSMRERGVVRRHC